MYFLPAGMLPRFVWFGGGLATVLVFVGVKMRVHDVLPIPALVSLEVVLALISGSVAASLSATRPPRPGRR